MNVLDLFSGIGGFSRGLERAGFTTIAFCEIEPYCRAVLHKHWPTTPCFEDVRTLDPDRLGGLPRVDVVCGGFPCQDISLAGDGAGLAGERSGLWREFRRIIALTRPAYAIIENVSALRSRGLDQVLGQLAAIGYDAEWHCIPAAAIGALHRRDRVWIVAYPERQFIRIESGWCGGTRGAGAPLLAINGQGWPLADPHEPRLERWLRAELRQCACECATGPRSAFTGTLADADGARQHELAQRDVCALWREPGARGYDADGCSGAAGWLAESGVGGASDGLSAGMDGTAAVQCPWGAGWEDGVPRVANDAVNRVRRLRALGNSIVPQLAELIGRAIMKAEQEKATAVKQR